VINLRSSVTALRGIGPAFGRALGERGLTTVGDLLALLPLGYEDRRRVLPIDRLVDQVVSAARGAIDGTVLGSFTVRGRVVSSRATFSPGRGRGGAGFEAFLEDPQGDEAGGGESGPPSLLRGRPRRLRLRWFRAFAGLSERLRVGEVVWVVGDLSLYRGAPEMVHPEVTASVPRPAVRPRYPMIEGVPPARLSAAVAEAARVAEGLSEPLPLALLARRQLPPRGQALVALHAPPDDISGADLELLADGESPSHQRLAYDEMLTFQLGLLNGLVAASGGVATARLPATFADAAALDDFRARLPFALTGAQSRVIGELQAALAGPTPVFRLLQGDVGSGKTAVALALAHLVLRSGAQVALMAPTEVLAEQHHRLARRWLEPLGHPVLLRTSATSRPAAAGVANAGAAPGPALSVGTHALFQEGVQLPRLGLVIIDEQHRFGVRERLELVKKGQTAEGARPHLLVMSATPIPRTLALFQHGPLELATLDEMPPGRQPPRTAALFGAQGRKDAYALLFDEVKAGGRAFVICPAIGDRDAADDQAAGPRMARAERLYPWLSQRLPGQVALCHGGLSSVEKMAALGRFAAGEATVLVATTVVEVGVDVPEASLMLVENAERFGLAQLHQLRGRVGRGGQASSCLLVAQPGESEEADALARRRLEVLEKESDGFAVAEADLALRGPGQLLGLRQAGVPRWRFADPLRHAALLAQARADAAELLDADPQLARPEHAGLRAWLDQRAREELGAGDEDDGSGPSPPLAMLA
jgi:ATP-dependent DNA helicase RecG